MEMCPRKYHRNSVKTFPIYLCAVCSKVLLSLNAKLLKLTEQYATEL